MTVHCKTCKHEWELSLKFPMRLSTFTEMTKAGANEGCPKCGGMVLCGSVKAHESLH